MRTSLEPTAGTTAVTPDRRIHTWRHVLVYFWLAFATWSAMQDTASTTRSWLAVALVVVLGGWYWLWQVAQARPDRDRVYSVGALLLWVPLVVLDPAFVVAGVAVVAPYCFSSARWALVSLAPYTVVWLWQGAAQGGLEWADVAVALAVVASAMAVSGYIGALTRQNAARQQLIDQLQATRNELAAAERRAGMLAERHRLARDIHDTLTQGFASIVMLLEAAEASLDTGRIHRRNDGFSNLTSWSMSYPPVDGSAVAVAP